MTDEERKLNEQLTAMGMMPLLDLSSMAAARKNSASGSQTSMKGGGTKPTTTTKTSAPAGKPAGVSVSPGKTVTNSQLISGLADMGSMLSAPAQTAPPKNTDTSPKQTSTPTAYAAGVPDSRERAQLNSQITSGLANMGDLLAVDPSPQARELAMKELLRQEQEAKHQYYFLKGFEQDGTGGHLYRPNSPYGSSVEALKAWREIQQKIAERANTNYHTRNERAWTRLAGDASSRGVYTGVQDAQAEADKVLAVLKTLSGSTDQAMSHEEYTAAKKHIMDTYGVGEEAFREAARSRTYDPDSGVYTNLWQLYDDLTEQAAGGVARLASAGYDYEDMEEYVRRLEAEEQARARDQRTAEFVSQNGWNGALGSAASVAATPVKGFEYLGAVVGNLGHNDVGDLSGYRPLDTSGMRATRYSDTVRGTVSENIQNSFDNKAAGGFFSFLYDSMMGLADSGAMTAAFGPGAPLLLAGSTAASEAKDIAERGGTAEQAALGGFAAGTAEYIFEKMGVDSLLDLKHVKNPESWIRRGLKQGGLETGGETLTAVSQLLTDTAIMGENSRFERLVDHYMGEELLTEEEARGRAFLDTLKGIILAGFGGFLSGSVLGGTKAGLDSWAGTRSQKAQDAATRAEIDLVDFLQGKYNDGTETPSQGDPQNGSDGAEADSNRVEMR